LTREQLEQRLVPSGVVLQVTSLADSLTQGTLRWAITTADAGAPTDRYVIDIEKAGTIALGSVLPDLGRNITIKGLGASTSTVERDPAASPFGIFTVDKGETVTIAGLTIKGGDAGSGNGGGLDNFGTVTVSNSAFTGNSANDGGGLANESGGTATISGSTFTRNSAVDGGGFANFGRASASGSTFTGNSADFGGGLANSGTARVVGSTFTRNSATDGGGLGNFGMVRVVGGTFTRNSASEQSSTRGGGGLSPSGPPAPSGPATCSTCAPTVQSRFHPA
jgi:hypothetical protein